MRAIQAGAQEREAGQEAEGKKEREEGKVEVEEREREERDDSDAVDIEWPLALMLVKRA